MRAERTLVVPPERTVGHFVPGMPMVYATPMMILEMEMAAGDAIRGLLENGWVTVGTEVDIKPSRRLAGRRDGADHGEGGRGGAPRDPFRGRSLRRRAQDRRRPPRPRPRQRREFQQAAGEVATPTPRAIPTDLILKEHREAMRLEGWPLSTVVASILRDAARRCAAPRDRVSTSPVPSTASSPRRPRGSSAAAGRRRPSALPAPLPWCRRAR